MSVISTVPNRLITSGNSRSGHKTNYQLGWRQVVRCRGIHPEVQRKLTTCEAVDMIVADVPIVNGKVNLNSWKQEKRLEVIRTWLTKHLELSIIDRVDYDTIMEELSSLSL
jgi:hypothetical protein